MSGYLLHITSDTDDEVDPVNVRTTSHIVAGYQSVARCYTSPGAALWLLSSRDDGLTEQLRILWDGEASVELAIVGAPQEIVAPRARAEVPA